MSGRMLMFVCVVASLLSVSYAAALDPRHFSTFDVRDGSGNFTIAIRDWTGVIAVIQPIINDPFSFTINDTAPNDRIEASYHSTGDVTFRVRPFVASAPVNYTQYSTADRFNDNSVTPIAMSGVLYAADVTPLISPGHGLSITRVIEQADDGFSLTTVMHNGGADPLELGAVGVSFAFNNDWTKLHLPAAAAHCSITEPYIAGDNAFVKVTRLSGTGRILLVVPSLTIRGGMEGWRPLVDDLTKRSGTFEGFYEYMFLASAWRENEWKSVSEDRLWTPTSSLVIQANTNVSFKLIFRMLPDVQSIESGLMGMGRPVVKAVPGYVISTDMRSAALMIQANGFTNLQVSADQPERLAVALPTKLSALWYKYPIQAIAYGPARVTVSFWNGDGTVRFNQSVNFFSLPPLLPHVSSAAAFTTANQWFDDETDPFGRGFAFMGWDDHTKQIILQDDMSVCAGLSDEPGSGAGLSVAIKNQFLPNATQIRLLDMYINRTLFGLKGPNQFIPHATRIQWSDYSVRASMFFYPGMDKLRPDFHYNVTRGLTEEQSNSTARSYNYVHPTAIYFALYQISRNNDLMILMHDWSWYLQQAYQTYIAMNTYASGLAQYGLMVASVYLSLLHALQEEGYITEYNIMYKLQYNRALVWQSLPFPFGSEFPWDSTGQEEIFMSAREFGLYDLSNSTLAAVLAYTHSIPSWGYHGSARRYWDFAVNGSPELKRGIERVLHHYGSGLNSIVLLSAYESDPNRVYLLEVGIGSITGVMTNIQENGASSMGYHADPSKLLHDYWSADYGMALFGSMSRQTAYAINHPLLGPQCYLCDLDVIDNANKYSWTITPRDAVHRRLYFEPIGTAFSLDNGHWTMATLNFSSRTVAITLSSPSSSEPLFTNFRLRVDHVALCSARPACQLILVTPARAPVVRGAYEIPFVTGQTANVVLQWTDSDLPILSTSR